MMLSARFDQYYNPAAVVEMLLGRLFRSRKVSHEVLMGMVEGIVGKKHRIMEKGIEDELRKRRILFDLHELDDVIKELLAFHRIWKDDYGYFAK